MTQPPTRSPDDLQHSAAFARVLAAEPVAVKGRSEPIQTFLVRRRDAGGDTR